MKTLKNVIVVILLILLAILGWREYHRWSYPPPPNIIYDYTTDTIYVDKFIPYERDSSDVITPPKTVIIYKDTTIWLTRAPTIRVDSILVPVKPEFLLELESTKDELSLTFIDTTSTVRTLKWPVTYDYFEYHYANSELSRKSTGYIAKSSIDWKALYINTDYDFVSNNPALFLDYQVDIRRLRFGAEARTTFTDVDPLGFRVKIGYRLFK